MRSRRYGPLSLLAVLAAVFGVLVVPAAAGAAPPPSAQGTTAGAAWQVTGAAGAFVVRWTSPTRLPVRAAAPFLAVDGRVLGVAVQDRDGRTLTVRTDQAWVAGAARVDLAWNGVVPGPGTTSSGRSAPAATPAPTGAVLAQDPATATTYRVARADYDLGDTAVRLPGLGGRAVELRAAVYLPVGAPGPRPVVVFLHGRHEACYGSGDVALGWPCPAGQEPVPSHLGYGQAANALAAAGQVVVSVSADGINALDYAATDGGAEARGELVLAHLDQLRAWNAGRGTTPAARALTGRLDLSDVGLMGHSRGGEGVVKAALLNAERPAPYGIRAVMPLAPVDFARSTLPNAALAVVLPYCDGDVWDQQGQHFYDDTRYATRDGSARTSLLVLGANHNYFNSEWTPGTSVAPSRDDWFDRSDPECGTSAPSRLKPAEQRAVGAAYISGFFRLHLGGETRFLPLFDGSGGRAASAGRAVVYTQAQQPAGSRTDLAPLTGRSASVRTTAGATYCASYGEAPAHGLPPCAGPPREEQFEPHWTRAYLATDVPASPLLRMTWTAAAPQQSVRVAVARPPAGVRQALTFRTAPVDRRRADLLVTLTDAAGHTASVPASRFGAALDPLPVLTGLGARPEPKTWLRTVRIPLSTFAGVDLRTLTAVTFASRGTAGDVYLSDVALDAPAPGAGAPTPLPSVSIGDADVSLENRPARADLLVTLSQVSPVPVTVWVQTGVLFQDDRVGSAAFPVTIPAGATTGLASFVVRPGDPTSDHLDEYPVSISVPTGAVIGDGLGTVTVYANERAPAPVAAG